MTKLFQHPNLRQEMIQFQTVSDKFGKEAEEIFTRIYDQIERGYIALEVQKLPEIAQLQDLIFKRFKIKTAIFTEGTLAAIIPFYLNQNHIFLHKTLGRGQVLLMEQEDRRVDGESGWVDLETATVGGVFSKYPSSLYLNFNALKYAGLSVQSAVGVLLHELGHYFYGCLHTSRLDRSNQIFNEALKKAKGGKMDVLFVEVSKSVKNLDQSILVGLESNDPIVFGRNAIKLANEICMSQLTDATYDATSFEMLADNFATRFGYGEETIKGLEKITGGVSDEYLRQMVTTFLTVYIQATSLVKALIILKYMSNGGMIPGFLSGYLWGIATILLTGIYFGYVLILTSGETGKNYTYDDLTKRYNRIRAQIIEQVKAKAYNKADTKTLIDSIETIGKLLEGTKTYRGPIDFLFNTFNPRDRRALASVKRQQAIEDLFTNELFVKSLKLNMGAA